jgi:hypothetical protein
MYRVHHLVTATAIVGLVAGGAVAQSFGAPKPAYPTSFQGISPDAFDGNDSAAGTPAQVCAAMGYAAGSFTNPANVRGEKIDPPVAYSDGNMSFILDATGTYIAWSAANADVKAVLVKGGNGYHIYRYAGTGLKADSWLASPLNNGGNVAEVSHYSFCYEYVPPVSAEGCTPGYWRNHVDRWQNYATTDSFSGVFGAGPNATLQQVVSSPQTYGAAAMHFAAALLNSTGGVPNGDGELVDYKYTNAEVIAMVQAAYAAGVGSTTFKKIFGQLSAANEAGCPLSGTPAFRG